MTGKQADKTTKMYPASSSDELSQGRSGHPVAESVPIISIKVW